MGDSVGGTGDEKRGETRRCVMGENADLFLSSRDDRTHHDHLPFQPDEPAERHAATRPGNTAAGDEYAEGSTRKAGAVRPKRAQPGPVKRKTEGKGCIHHGSSSSHGFHPHLPAIAVIELSSGWARIPRGKVNFERGARNCCFSDERSGANGKGDSARAARSSAARGSAVPSCQLRKGANPPSSVGKLQSLLDQSRLT